MSTDSKEIIFSVQDLHKVYGKKEVLAGITLGFYYGAKIGIIGSNGSGKSTLLRVIAGVEKEIDGQVTFKRGTTVGYLPQEPQLDPEKTVRENVEDGAHAVRSLITEYEEITAKLGEDLSDDAMQAAYDRMGELQEKIDQADGWEIDRQIDQAMHALLCPPGDSSVANLSGGEQRRVAICRELLRHPDILLLDEPTNHLDAATTAWLERYLAEYSGTVILVTHDRYFLDNVVGWMLEIEQGTGSPYEGNYSEYLDQKSKQLAQQKRSEGRRQKVLERELEWIRQTPKGRMTKSRARISNFERLVEESEKVAEDAIGLSISPGRRLGDRVAIVQGVSKSYDGKELFHDLSFELPPGGIVGVIGPNGAGKTTLLRLLVGQEEPDTGEVVVGETVDLCYVDQRRQDLEDSKTIFEEISEGYDTFKIGKREINSRSYVARFGFSGEAQEKSVGALSGGQRNRVQMAKMLRRGGNVILLDEPTNDLDIPTLRLLEEALMSFPGCAVVVSHDRYFLDRVATHILAFEESGDVRYFEGSYQAYADRMEAERKERGEKEPTAGTFRRFK
ncbi:MAG: energy-dependent translational throttle protein EttA [Planctomycetota bacterium]